MKKLLFLFVLIICLSCNNDRQPADIPDTKIALRSDTLNIVKLTDTLVINESTCRGCAFEGSTAFAVKDSLELVKFLTVETTDNNPEGMSGGNVSKRIFLVPIKIGTTVLRMYKFWKGVPTAMTDSITPTATYKIEIQN